MHDLRLIQNNGLDIMFDYSIRFPEVFAHIETVSKVTGASIEQIKEVMTWEIKQWTPSGDEGLDRYSEEMGFNRVSPVSDSLEKLGFLNEDRIADTMITYAPDLAKNCAALFGIRGFFHELAGFEIKSNYY